MVVHDVDAIRLAVASENTPPSLFVNANAVLVEPITLRRFQEFAERDAQTIQGRGGMHPHPLSQCDTFKRLEPLHAVTLE